MTSTTPDVASPCCGVCRIDEQSYCCLGCWRSLDEIARWTRLSNDEKAQVLTLCQSRQQLAENAPDGGDVSTHSEHVP